MSSATAQATFRPFPGTMHAEGVLFRIKLTAHILFGCLVLIQSLYLVMCYITFDFYGALTSQFFSWLRTAAGIAHLAYMPLFCGALFAAGLALRHWDKQRVNRLIGALLGTQVLVGLLLFLSHGPTEYFVWPLLFGPHNRTSAIAGTEVFWESVACLIPLSWICLLHVAGTLGRLHRETLSSRWRLTPFLVAGLATSLLYQIAAHHRMSANGEALSGQTVAFSVIAHTAAFVSAFLVMNSVRVVSNLFPNPRVARFLFHCLYAWLFLAVILRKIIFGLLAFSSSLADWYSIGFSLAVVLFGASVAANLAHRRELATIDTVEAPRRPGWTVRVLPLGAALACFVCSMRVTEVDWAHVLSSLAFVFTWVSVLSFCLVLFTTKQARAGTLLVLLAVCDLAGFAGMRAALQRPNIAQAIEQYSTYDPSIFVLDTLFKPALQDERYAAWYTFLTQHASIRSPIEAPTVALTANLKATAGYKPHIFIFVIDALRRDYVSAYNPRVNFTPNMQEFAADSVVFRHAYSSYAGTALADPSLFAGFQQINKTFPSPLTRENNLQPMLDVDDYDCYVSFNSIVKTLYADYPRVTPLKVDRGDQLDFGPIAHELETDLMNRKDRTRPIFVFAQPTNVHTLFLAWHGHKAEVTPHPGFDDKYASAVERVDRTFGEFIAFLKQQGLYQDSVIIITADHGESLGEMGRTSHVANVTPEVFRIPFIVHLPQRLKSRMVWNADGVVKLRDVTPTLYYLLGHRPINADPMIGRPLFTLTAAEQERAPVDHYFLMSSYQAVFGILSADRQQLFMTDAVLHRNFYYDLSTDPMALRNRATAEIVEHYQPILRKDLEDIDKFYGVSEQQLSR